VSRPCSRCRPRRSEAGWVCASRAPASRQPGRPSCVTSTASTAVARPSRSEPTRLRDLLGGRTRQGRARDPLVRDPHGAAAAPRRSGPRGRTQAGGPGHTRRRTTVPSGRPRSTGPTAVAIGRDPRGPAVPSGGQTLRPATLPLGQPAPDPEPLLVRERVVEAVAADRAGAQMRFASRVEPPFSGKKASGSASRHLASSIHARSSASNASFVASSASTATEASSRPTAVELHGRHPARRPARQALNHYRLWRGPSRSTTRWSAGTTRGRDRGGDTDDGPRTRRGPIREQGLAQTRSSSASRRRRSPSRRRDLAVPSGMPRTFATSR
jgi:hypothetical protein